MTTAFDSFQASPLGAFVQSPLDARGVGEGTAQPCAVFAADFALADATRYVAAVRTRGSGLITTLPNLSIFGANANGGMQEGDRDNFTQFQLAQQFTATASASVCNGGDSVTITEGGELTITTSPRTGVPVPDFRGLERFWPLGADGGGVAQGDVTSLSTCSGDGSAGRWTQSVACGSLRSEAATMSVMQNNILNVDQRQLLIPGTTASSNDVAGHRLDWPGGVIADSAERLWFVRTATFSSNAPSAQVPALIALRRGSFVGTVDSLDWYAHADMPGQCIFNWPPLPLSGGSKRLVLWYTTAAGEGADKLGLGLFGFGLGMRAYS